MSFPQLTNGRVDKQLSNILMAYTNADFIVDQVLPTVPNLKEESGKIASLGNAHLRVYDSKRALWDESGHRMEYTISNSDSYQIEYHDLESYLPDRLLAQLQDPFDGRRDAGVSLSQAIMLERESALATALTSTSLLTNNTTLSGTSQWSDKANSDPLGDIETARTSVHSKTGREATDIIVERRVLVALKEHPAVVNQFTGYSSVSQEKVIAFLKDYFGFKRVHVAKSIYVSSQEGQTEALGHVWNKDVIVFSRPDMPSLFAPSFGYSFKLQGQDMRADLRRHSNDLGDILRVMYAYQDKILDADSAYLIKNAIA